MLKAAIVATLLVIAGTIGMTMNDPKLGGMSISEVFSDPKAAKLAKAACGGDTSRIATLIAEGVDVNAKGQDGIVPLFYALKCEQPAGPELIPITQAPTVSLAHMQRHHTPTQSILS